MTGRVNQDVTILSQVEDDGLPRSSALKITWKKTSGPGNVTFSDASSATTRATSSAPGKYEVELSATDGERTTSVKVAVTIAA